MRYLVMCIAAILCVVFALLPIVLMIACLGWKIFFVILGVTFCTALSWVVCAFCGWVATMIFID